MELIISNNLRKALEDEKELVLNKESPSRVIVNMQQNSAKGFRVLNDSDLDDYQNASDNGLETKKASFEDKTNKTMEEVIKYVNEHTSGTLYGYELSDSGAVIVSFSQFVAMVEDGYNIVKSEVLTSNYNYISIEYQKEMKKTGKFR